MMRKESTKFICKSCKANMLVGYVESPSSPVGEKTVFYTASCQKCKRSVDITVEKMKDIERLGSDTVEL